MKRYGLIGHPLGHSFSKAYFTEKFEKEGLDCEYQNFDLKEISLIQPLVADHPDLKGFNVTIPYKEAVIPYLNEIDETAKEIGAVNTVKVLPNGQLKGFNTDVIGIEDTLWGLRDALKGTSVTPEGGYVVPLGHLSKPCLTLILGTGGASKAIQYVLKKHHLPYHLVSRDPNKGHFTYETLSPEIIKKHLLIINATPVGMAPNIDESPAIPYEALTAQHILFDLIYNPEETQFLRNGKAKGAQTINGLTMLYAQAKASWEIWNLRGKAIFFAHCR